MHRKVLIMGIFNLFKKKNDKKADNTTAKEENIQTEEVVATQPKVKESESSKDNLLVEEEKNRLNDCKYDLVVIDFETTGIKTPLDSLLNGTKYDEVLSVSIIDQDGNTLLHTLCKPKLRKSWAKAQEIHGITPAMVKDKQPFEEVFPKVKEILLNSKLVIAYNIEFELGFLWGYDAICDFVGEGNIREDVVWGSDPMLMYCAYKGNEKYQKLTAAAKHFKFNFEAHDSLEDVKATLFCYKKMIEFINANEDKEYIYKYGFLYDKGVKGRWIDRNTFDIFDETQIKK